MGFVIKRIGWIGDNKKDFIVRLSKEDRNQLGVQQGAIVRVRKGNKQQLAIVKSLFIDLVAIPDSIAVNNLLARKMELNMDDEVEITRDVTNEEVGRYTSQDEFERRQVLGVVLQKEEKKKTKDILAELGITDEQSSQANNEESVAGEQNEQNNN